MREKIKELLKVKTLKEISVESGVSYFTLYNFLNNYSRFLSKKNEEMIKKYLESLKKK